jgi:hypothetical protein
LQFAGDCGAADYDLICNPHQRCLKTQAGFDAHGKQVQRVREVFEDRALPLCPAARQHHIRRV